MITIDGQEYKKEEMSKDQIRIFGTISNLNQRKHSHLQEAEQTEILIQHYIGEFKELHESQKELKDTTIGLTTKEQVEAVEFPIKP